MLETSNVVHGSAMWSLSLVMSECSLSGRGQGHVSNVYIVDLENFATASRRYTGDIHNTSVVGLFMTPIDWVDRVMVECTLTLSYLLTTIYNHYKDQLVVGAKCTVKTDEWTDSVYSTHLLCSLK